MIEDNGTNNNGIIYSDGIGLENMKIRTESLGGIFKYYSEKNKFKIFISIQKARKNVMNIVVVDDDNLVALSLKNYFGGF